MLLSCEGGKIKKQSFPSLGVSSFRQGFSLVRYDLRGNMRWTFSYIIISARSMGKGHFGTKWPSSTKWQFGERLFSYGQQSQEGNQEAGLPAVLWPSYTDLSSCGARASTWAGLGASATDPGGRRVPASVLQALPRREKELCPHPQYF